MREREHLAVGRLHLDALRIGEDLRGRTYAKTGRAILGQPGGVAFQILDAKARKLDLYPTNYDTATVAKAD